MTTEEFTSIDEIKTTAGTPHSKMKSGIRTTDLYIKGAGIALVIIIYKETIKETKNFCPNFKQIF